MCWTDTSVFGTGLKSDKKTVCKTQMQIQDLYTFHVNGILFMTIGKQNKENLIYASVQGRISAGDLAQK